MIEIFMVTDFHGEPSGRNRVDGEYSGQRFREEHLAPLLKYTLSRICVDLSNSFGYSNSFLRGAFGDLVEKNGFTQDELSRRLSFHPSEGIYSQCAWRVIEEAQKKSSL